MIIFTSLDHEIHFVYIPTYDGEISNIFVHVIHIFLANWVEEVTYMRSRKKGHCFEIKFLWTHGAEYFVNSLERETCVPFQIFGMIEIDISQYKIAFPYCFFFHQQGKVFDINSLVTIMYQWCYRLTFF